MLQTTPSTEPPPAARALHELSKEEIARLLNADQATAARLDVSKKIASCYGTDTLSQQESVIAEQIFRLLVRDTELSIRKQMSEHLKVSQMLPRDIALTMAADVAEVALPMLESSKVLSDQDLMDLIAASPDSARHMAIAKREEVSEKVVSSILEHNTDAAVACVLARNEGARMNEENMQLLIERYNDLPQVMDVLASRPSLPVNIAEKVVAHVSEQLKMHVAKTYHVGLDALAVPVQQSREAATLGLIRENISDTEMQKLVEQLVTFDRLTPSLLIAALAQGYVNFFVMCFAMLANIPPENAARLMRDKGGLGFRALYNKAAMPAEYFATMRDIMPHAMALKEEMPALEMDAFAKMLAKKIAQYGKSEGVIVDYLVKLVENSGK